MTTILCVDDDRQLTDVLCYALVREGYVVRVAHSGEDAMRTIHRTPPDLVLLDVSLPDISGFEVVARLRACSRLPVIIVSERTDEEDMLIGYRLGVDDYVAKPFNLQALMCRVRAVLRWTRFLPLCAPRRRYLLGDVTFDPQANQIAGCDGRHITLTPVESQILHLLVLYDGQHLSADDLTLAIRNREGSGSAAAIKTHIRHLRGKMGTLLGETDVILTDRGQGYTVRSVRAVEEPALVESA